jgi:hypothetical protein
MKEHFLSASLTAHSHYEYRPDDIQKVYDKEAIREYAC